MISKKLYLLNSSTILSSRLINDIISRIEYAGNLLIKYTPIGSLSVFVEKSSFGTSISTLKRVGGGAFSNTRGGVVGIGVGPGGMLSGAAGSGIGPGGAGPGPSYIDDLIDSGYIYNPATNTISNANFNLLVETNPAMFGPPGDRKTLTIIFNGLPPLGPDGQPYPIRYTLTISHAGQWFFSGVVSGFTPFKIGTTILGGIASSTTPAIITVRPLDWMVNGTVGFALSAEIL